MGAIGVSDLVSARIKRCFAKPPLLFMPAFPHLVLIVLSLPWLNPFADGPSSTVTPLLVTFVCTGLALLLAVARRVHRLHALFYIATTLVLTLASKEFGLEWLTSCAAAMVVWACVALASGERRATQRVATTIAWAWLVAAVVSAAFAGLQYFGLAENFYPWVSASADATAYGNLRQRNQLATLMMIGLFALMWLVRAQPKSHTGGDADARAESFPYAPPDAPPGVRSDASRGSRLASVLWPILAALVLTAANALTASRTGLVAIAMLLVLAWCWRASQPPIARWVVGLCVPTYAATAWLAPLVQGAGSSSAFVRLAQTQGSCTDRTVMWANVWELILQRPWTGWGWRELAWAHYQGVFEQRFCLILDNAHNLPLHLAVELGLPVALAVCAAIGLAVWRGKPWRETDATRQLAWGVLLVIGLHSMVEYPLWYGPFQMAVGLAVGLLVATRSVQNEVQTPNFKRKSLYAGVFWSFVATVLIAGSVFAAWDYSRVSQIYMPVDQRREAYRGDALAQIGSSWLFANQLDFARLTVTPLTRANAAQQRVLAEHLLHYAPEPRVIEVLIESASLMGDLDAAVAELRRYKAAFPAEYGQWSQRNQAAAGAK